MIAVSGGPPETLLDLGEPARGVRLSDVELVRWRAADGWDLEGVLVKPLGFRPGRRYPLLVDIHGGPAPGGTAYFKRAWHWLAAQGYMVFSPDFRGGQTYAWAGPLTVKEDYLDTMAGVDALIAAGHVDPDRMGIYGFSYGADLVAWVLGHTGRFAAAALACGGCDPLVSYGLAWGAVVTPSSPRSSAGARGKSRSDTATPRPSPTCTGRPPRPTCSPGTTTCSTSGCSTPG